MGKYFCLFLFIYLLQNVASDTFTYNHGVTEHQNLCGIMSASRGLIQNGNYSKINDFPWMATIVDHMHVNGVNSSGALISSKHVLTRGKIFPHWSDVRFWWNVKKLINWNDLSNIKIYLGSLQHISDKNVYDIDHVHLQPDRKKIGQGKYFNNLAIIRLKTAVEFSDLIRPVCLWNFTDINLKHVQFFAAGYGRDSSGSMTNFRKFTRVTFQRIFTELGDTSTSSRINTRIEIIGSNSGSACEFDETLSIKYNGIWYLKGILAEDFRFNNKTCNSDTSFLYEDVSQHIEWIESKINN